MEQIIEIRVLSGRKCIQLHQRNKEFVIDKIEIGTGKYKKDVKYTPGLLKSGTETRAIILSEGKVKIIV